MNLYVILLEKKSSLKKAGFSGFKISSGSAFQSWFSLGHFDAIHTYIINLQKDLFSTIQENNSLISRRDTEERHYHPLYLVSETNDDDFWQHEESPFIAVSRIHYNSTTGANNIYAQLKHDLVQNLDEKLDVRIYRTIELCDAVLVAKSDSLPGLLDFALKLRKHSNIGRVYSYFAIRDKNLNNNWMPPNDETIPLCSIRFAVSSFPDAQREIDALRKQPFSGLEQPFLIIGVDDVLITWKNMLVRDFLSIYRHWFVEKENELDKAFSSMTTRLGIEYGDTSDWAPAASSKGLQAICKDIKTLCDSVFQQEAIQERTWLRPLSELCYSLLRLSRMPILDEFAYLMIPGVRAFLIRLNAGNILDDAECQTFVRNWSSVMEHVMRGEGQMTQYPQLRPVLFDIPVAMLEYILAFLDTVADILRKADPEPDQISLFPVPVLDKRISAKELFSPSKGVPGLVLIMIPLEMLYKPSDMLTALCHELSHFIGESCRERTKRIECYANAVSFLFTKRVFSYSHNSLAVAISNKLLCCLNRIQTIEKMEEAVQDWAKSFKMDVTISEQMIAEIKQQRDSHDSPLPYLPYLIRDARNADYSLFYSSLKDFSILFRECFADLCMMYLLQVEPRNYILSHLKDWSIPSNKNKHYEQVGIRIFSVLNANPDISPERIKAIYNQLQDVIDFTLEQEKENYYRLKEEIEWLCDTIPTGMDSNRASTFPVLAVYSLLRYTRLCYCSLQRTIRREDILKLEKMRNTVLASPMDYSAFLSYIDEYRRKIHTDYSKQSVETW